MASIRLLAIGSIGWGTTAKHHLPYRKDENSHAQNGRDPNHSGFSSAYPFGLDSSAVLCGLSGALSILRSMSSPCCRLVSVMSNPWDVLPIADEGDREENEIFVAVGMALTSWERLEFSRSNIFGALVFSRSGAAERAFGTISSSAGRAEMIMAAAKPILSANKPLAGKLRSLMTDIEKLAGRRNDIAHGTVTHFSSSEEGSEPVEHGAYLVPAYYNTRKMLDPSDAAELATETFIKWRKYAYTSAQIRQYVAHFTDYRIKANDLHQEIWAYCQQLFPPQLPPGIFVEQAPAEDQITQS